MSGEDKIFKNRVCELAKRAYFGGYTVTSDFMNIQEQSLVKSLPLNCKPTFYGGYNCAERVVCAFNGSREPSNEEFGIRIVFVKPVSVKFAQTLTHRDFLGSLMGLGIDRRVLGDILVVDNCAYIFCLSKIADFLVTQLKQVKSTQVTCEIISELPEIAIPDSEECEMTVSSLRLDVLICAVYGLSRSECSKLFLQQRVFVNSVCEQSASVTAAPGDIISVRGRGRFVYSESLRTTKKGRLAVKILKY